MGVIVIEGDPGQLRSLLDELYDRNYLPGELVVTVLDHDPIAVLREAMEKTRAYLLSGGATRHPWSEIETALAWFHRWS